MLDLSLEDTAAAMGTTVPAVKAALARARANVAKPPPPCPLEQTTSSASAATPRCSTPETGTPCAPSSAPTPASKSWRASSAEAPPPPSTSRYAEVADLEALRLEAGHIGGAAVIAVYRSATSEQPAYSIQLRWRGEHVERVRDYRYVPYIAREAHFTPEPAPRTP